MIREPPLSAKCVPGLGEPWLRKPALSSCSSQSYVEENYFGCAEWLRRNKDHHCGHHHPHCLGNLGGPGLLLKLQRQRSCLWSPVAPLKKAKKKQKQTLHELLSKNTQEAKTKHVGHGKQARTHRGRFLKVQGLKVPIQGNVLSSSGPKELAQLPSIPRASSFLTWSGGRGPFLSYRISGIPLSPCHIWPGRFPF